MDGKAGGKETSPWAAKGKKKYPRAKGPFSGRVKGPGQHNYEKKESGEKNINERRRVRKAGKKRGVASNQ